MDIILAKIKRSTIRTIVKSAYTYDQALNEKRCTYEFYQGYLLAYERMEYIDWLTECQCNSNLSQAQIVNF